MRAQAGLADARDRQRHLLRAARRHRLGGCFRIAFRPGAPSIVGSRACATTAPGRRSTIIWSCVIASGRDARRPSAGFPSASPTDPLPAPPDGGGHRQPKRQRPPKVAARAATMVGRKSRVTNAMQWWTPMAGRSSCTRTRQTSRTRRCRAAAAHVTPKLAVRAIRLRRRRLPRAACGRRQHHPLRNRAQARRSCRLRRSCQTLGGRALLLLDQSQSPARQGLRGDHRLRRGVPLRHFLHPVATQARTLTKRFEDP